MDRLAQKIFHLICVKNYSVPTGRNYENLFQQGLVEAEEFFNHCFDGKVDFKQKTVVDIGCGFGSACIYMG